MPLTAARARNRRVDQITCAIELQHATQTRGGLEKFIGLFQPQAKSFGRRFDRLRGGVGELTLVQRKEEGAGSLLADGGGQEKLIFAAVGDLNHPAGRKKL